MIDNFAKCHRILADREVARTRELRHVVCIVLGLVALLYALPFVSLLGGVR
jgi:hypothetical protein